MPFFFVSTGIKLDVDELFGSGSALVRVPLFLGALLVVRGLPALLYRPLRRARQPARRRRPAAGDVAQPARRRRPDRRRPRPRSGPTNYVALVAAGLLSVIVFPLVALTLLRGRPEPSPSRSRRNGSDCRETELACAHSPSPSCSRHRSRSPRAQRRRPTRSTVAVGKSAYGPVLFDGRGFALYVFTHDRTGRSTCSGACARPGRRIVVQRRRARRRGREGLAARHDCAAPTARGRSPTPAGRSTTTSATGKPARSSARTCPSSAASGSSSGRAARPCAEPSLSGAAAADDQVGDEPRPAGLVRGAEAGAGVAVEVLVEQDQVAPGRVVAGAARSRRRPAGVPSSSSQEERRSAAPASSSATSPRSSCAPEPVGNSTREVVAEVAVVDAQRLDRAGS